MNGAQESRLRRPCADLTPARFPVVDVLRGFAAVSVIVYHVVELMKWTAFPVDGPLVWFRAGGLGVDLFFVISGFVIALSAFGSIDRSPGGAFRRSFARRRIARIAPLYYVTAILFLACVAPEIWLRPDVPMQLVSHALFFHNMDWRTQGAIDGPNWSVGVEMQFYLLMLLAAPLLLRARPWAVAAVMVAVGWAWRACAFAACPIDGPLGPYLLFVCSTQLPGVLDEFAAGILLARLLRSGPGRRLLRAGTSRPWLPTAIAAGAVWMAMKVYWAHAAYWDSAPMVVFYKTLLAAAFAMAVFAACCLGGPILLRATAPLRYLGTISYGLYLWHLLVLQPLQRLPGLDPAVALAITLLTTGLLASLSWHFFERPFVVAAHRPRTALSAERLRADA